MVKLSYEENLVAFVKLTLFYFYWAYCFDWTSKNLGPFSTLLREQARIPPSPIYFLPLLLFLFRN